MGNTKTTPTLPLYPHKNTEKLWAKIKRPVAVLITFITFLLQPPPHLSQIRSSAIHHQFPMRRSRGVHHSPPVSNHQIHHHNKNVNLNT
ncbi:hypothetical protein QL285_034948 [Trifolium repens]|nr:hypothetical protein QL285_034948 [Trifolium repens]